MSDMIGADLDFVAKCKEAGRLMGRLRRMAKRKGYRFKLGRRSALPDYDLYAVIDLETGRPVNPPLAGAWEHSWGLAEVVAFLGASPEGARDIPQPKSTLH